MAEFSRYPATMLDALTRTDALTRAVLVTTAPSTRQLCTITLDDGLQLVGVIEQVRAVEVQFRLCGRQPAGYLPNEILTVRAEQLTPGGEIR